MRIRKVVWDSDRSRDQKAPKGGICMTVEARDLSRKRQTNAVEKEWKGPSPWVRWKCNPEQAGRAKVGGYKKALERARAGKSPVWSRVVCSNPCHVAWSPGRNRVWARSPTGGGEAGTWTAGSGPRWDEVGRSRCSPYQKRVGVPGPQCRTQQSISNVSKKIDCYSVLLCFLPCRPPAKQCRAQMTSNL